MLAFCRWNKIIQGEVPLAHRGASSLLVGPVTVGSWQGRRLWQECVMGEAAYLLVSRDQRKTGRGQCHF